MRRPTIHRHRPGMTMVEVLVRGVGSGDCPDGSWTFSFTIDVPGIPVRRFDQHVERIRSASLKWAQN